MITSLCSLSLSAPQKKKSIENNMMGDEEECNIKLCLGLGNGEKSQNNNKSVPVPVAACLDFSFTLCPKQEAMDVQVLHKPDEDNYFNNNSQNDEYITRRKKLRLTKEQSSFLEDSFKLHTTLNSFQKRALAEELNLKPRQVEVWFQNRRARTKLKQTELEYEILKKCCESLSDENKRLKKELQELKSEESGKSPLFIAKAAVMCPSCEKIIRTGDGNRCGPC